MPTTVRDLFKAHQVKPLGRYSGDYGDIIYFKTENDQYYYVTSEVMEKMKGVYTEGINQVNSKYLKYLDVYKDMKTPTISVFINSFTRNAERVLLFTVHGEQPVIPLNIKPLTDDSSKKQIHKLIETHLRKVRSGK